MSSSREWIKKVFEAWSLRFYLQSISSTTDLIVMQYNMVMETTSLQHYNIVKQGTRMYHKKTTILYTKE